MADTVTRTRLRTFTNSEARPWVVRVLPVGARYGRTSSLVADDDLVEFYDATHADDGKGAGDGFGPLGQFVSRYYRATLLGNDRHGTGTGGLDLDGGVPVWRIDESTMIDIRAWLAGEEPLPRPSRPWTVAYDPGEPEAPYLVQRTEPVGRVDSHLAARRLILRESTQRVEQD